MQGAPTRSRDFLEGLSFVLASRQRETVLAAVIPGPKTPVQVAKQTGLHLPHVSRALGQLVRTDLVERVAGQRRGRLYAASGLGRAVFGELAEERGDRIVAPMIRGGHLRNYHHWVAAHHTSTAADEILIGVGLDPSTVRADGWYPLRAALQALDAIEARFGDGTYETIRRMLREEARNFSSAKRLISRVIPFPLLLELSPNAYSGIQPRTPRGRGPGASGPAQELRLDQQPRPLCRMVGRVRGVRPDVEDRRHGHEGRLHAPWRPVLRLPARLVILARRTTGTERNKAW